MSQAGSPARAQTRRLVLMAVVAVMLGTVVAANIAEDPGATEDPRASFTFETDGNAVLVSYYGGDELDPASVFVESGVRGRLGNFDGSAGMACQRNVTQIERGSTCRVPNGTFERLIVVWEGEDERSLILAQRGPDPTPTPSLSPTPTVTETPATPDSTATATPTGTTRPGTPSTQTTSGGTTAPGTATATANGTAPAGGTDTATPTGTPTPGETATPAGTPPSDETSTPEAGTGTPANGTATTG